MALQQSEDDAMAVDAQQSWEPAPILNGAADAHGSNSIATAIISTAAIARRIIFSV